MKLVKSEVYALNATAACPALLIATVSGRAAASFAFPTVAGAPHAEVGPGRTTARVMFDDSVSGYATIACPAELTARRK